MKENIALPAAILTSVLGQRVWMDILSKYNYRFEWLLITVGESSDDINSSHLGNQKCARIFIDIINMVRVCLPHPAPV